MRAQPLEPPRTDGRLVCWTSSSPLPEPRAWARRVQSLRGFATWFVQNTSRYGPRDALYYAGHYGLARLDGRLSALDRNPRTKVDQDVRTRFCATLTRRRPIRAETVYVFAFLGEFGYELLNWQGVVRRLARRLPASSKIVVAGRRGLQPFYETAAQYIEIDDLPEYRESYAASYFAMHPGQYRRAHPPTQAQFDHDRRLRRAVESHVRRRLAAGAQRIEFVFSSQFNGLGDCEFGVDARF
jgi:hypothetical protein